MKRDVGGKEEAEHDILVQREALPHIMLANCEHECHGSCPSNSKTVKPAKTTKDCTDSSQACGRELMRKTVTWIKPCREGAYPVLRTFGQHETPKHGTLPTILNYEHEDDEHSYTVERRSTSDIPLGSGRRAQPQ